MVGDVLAKRLAPPAPWPQETTDEAVLCVKGRLFVRSLAQTWMFPSCAAIPAEDARAKWNLRVRLALTSCHMKGFLCWNIIVESEGLIVQHEEDDALS